MRNPRTDPRAGDRLGRGDAVVAVHHVGDDEIYYARTDTGGLWRKPKAEWAEAARLAEWVDVADEEVTI